MSWRDKKGGSNSNNSKNYNVKRVFCEPSKGFEVEKWAYLIIGQEPGYLQVQIQSPPIGRGGSCSRKVWLYHLRGECSEIEVRERYLAFEKGHAFGN